MSSDILKKLIDEYFSQYPERLEKLKKEKSNNLPKPDDPSESKSGEGSDVSKSAIIQSTSLTDPNNRWKDKFLVEKMHKDATYPTKANEYAAGYDLYAFEDVMIPAKGSAIVGTKIILSFPAKYFGNIKPRSGLGFKKNIDVFHGTIDTDYRGEIKVQMYNNSDEDFQIKHKDRIAQLVLHSSINIPLHPVKKGAIEQLVGKTDRGKKGFGSSGR